MIKEIIVCDECGRTLEKEEVKKYNFNHWCFELCSNCYEKKEGLKEECEKLDNYYDKKRDTIFKKYSIDKLINR